MNQALNEALLTATREIFDSLLGWEMESRPAVEHRGSDDAERAETSVIISFVGAESGAFVLRCSGKTASAMASAMLGVPVEDGSEDARDAVGEILNMIVGTAKTLYAATNESFKMSVPTTIIGRDYLLHISRQADSTVTILPFSCRGEQLSIAIYLN